MDASPSSIGPPTPVNGPCWANVDPAIVGMGPDSQYAPNVRVSPIAMIVLPAADFQTQQKKYPTNISPSWMDDRNVPFYEMKVPPPSAWPWMSMSKVLY